jgi:hypothetical protein
MDMPEIYMPGGAKVISKPRTEQEIQAVVRYRTVSNGFNPDPVWINKTGAQNIIPPDNRLVR